MYYVEHQSLRCKTQTKTTMKELDRLYLLRDCLLSQLSEIDSQIDSHYHYEETYDENIDLEEEYFDNLYRNNDDIDSSWFCGMSNNVLISDGNPFSEAIGIRLNQMYFDIPLTPEETEGAMITGINNVRAYHGL